MCGGHLRSSTRFNFHRHPDQAAKNELQVGRLLREDHPDSGPSPQIQPQHVSQLQAPKKQHTYLKHMSCAPKFREASIVGWGLTKAFDWNTALVKHIVFKGFRLETIDVRHAFVPCRHRAPLFRGKTGIVGRPAHRLYT